MAASVSDPIFLTVDTVIRLHHVQIERFGGEAGYDHSGEALVSSAVSAPQHSYLYEDEIDIFDLAAVYCSHISKNHGFVDGNKRTALAAALYFLAVNGIRIPDRAYDPYGAVLPDDVVAGVVEAHIRGEADRDMLAHLFFGLVGPDWIQEYTKEAYEKAKAACVKEGKATGTEEANAFFCDYLLTQMSALLVERCERYHINPKRIHAIDAAGKKSIVGSVNPTYQRVFGMVLSEFPDVNRGSE